MHARGHVWKGGMCGRGACLAGESATAADGTHHTGMHSCLSISSDEVSSKCSIFFNATGGNRSKKAVGSGN